MLKAVEELSLAALSLDASSTALGSDMLEVGLKALSFNRSSGEVRDKSGGISWAKASTY